MYLVDRLNWVFPFGKFEGKTVLQAIESNPTFSSDGTIDAFGKLHWVGEPILSNANLISYLEWAEEKEILKVSEQVWMEIKAFNEAFTKSRLYENGGKQVTINQYEEFISIMNEMKSRF